MPFAKKIDIFKGICGLPIPIIWRTGNDKVEQVKEIMALNKKKKRVASLEEYAIEAVPETVEKNFKNAVGQDSLTRFDAKPKRKKKPNNRKKNANPNTPNKQNTSNNQIKPNNSNNRNAKEIKHFLFSDCSFACASCDKKRVFDD